MRALTLPENATDLAGWLEAELVGLDLRRLAAELATVHRGSQLPIGTFDDWLASYRDAILRRGLRRVPPERLAALLRRPDWLLELQQLVLSEGGPYWDEVPRSPEVERRADRAWQKLSEHLDPPATPSGNRGWWLRTVVPALAASLVTAAAVLLVVALNPQFLGNRAVVVHMSTPDAKEVPKKEAAAPWGFAKFAGQQPEVNREQYLRQLATSALEWPKQRPTDAAGMARRLGEFRQGCSAILLAEHKALTPADQVWLKERCRTWAEAFDRHLAAIESGADPLAVRAEVDGTVTKIAAALLGRAETPPT